MVKMYRARILRLGVAWLCVLLAGPAAAQAWHTLATGIPAGQAPSDLAFTVNGTTGGIDAWVVSWDGVTPGGAGTAFPVTLPTSAPPTVGTAQPLTGIVEAPRVATDGTEVLVVYGGPGIEDFDGVATWTVVYPTSLSAAGPAVHGVAIDASAVVVTTDASLSRYNLAVRVGATWTQTVATSVANIYGPVALSGTAGLLLPSNQAGLPAGATDATLASGWMSIQPAGFDPSGQVISVTGVGFFAVGKGGLLGFTPSSTTAFTTTSSPGGTPSFTRVVCQASPSQCWIAGDDGSIHQVLTPTTTPDWTTSTPLATGLASLSGLAVTGPRQILIAGTDPTGGGVVAWRNRPPNAPTGLPATAAAVNEGDPVGVQISATATDPDNDTPLTATWSCTGLPNATFTPATALTTTLTVPDDPAFCPSAGPKTYNCQVAASDAEPATSPAATFTVQVTPVDITPPQMTQAPTVTPPGLVAQGAQMSATMPAPTDTCSAVTTTFDVLDTATSQPVAGLTVTQPPPYVFSAPPPGTYVVRVTATDASGNFATLTSQPFTVAPAPDITMTCPSVLPRGVPTTFTAVPTAGVSGDVTRYDWTPGQSTSDVAVKADPGPPATLQLTPGQCTHQASVDVSVTATGPGGTGTASCPAVPIDPTFPAPTVTAPTDVTVPVGAKGGSAPITVSVAETCTPATISLAWDLSGLPAAARPTDAPASGAPGDFTATIRVAAADAASVLGPTGARDATVTVKVGDDLGATPIVKTIAVHFVAHGALDVSVATPGEEGEVAEGAIVAVDTQVTSLLPFASAGVDLGLHGFSLAKQATPQVLGGCGAKASVAAASGGATVMLSPMPSACPVTVRLFLRRDDGLGKVTVDGCTVGGKKVACTGDVPVKRSEVLGCSSAGGDGSLWALVLALGALVLRRRARAGRGGPA